MIAHELHVKGSPIGGENPPQEHRWRAATATAATGIAPAGAVRVHFRLEPHRTVDLNNLVRPALAGLRDAGVLQWARLPAATAVNPTTDPPTPVRPITRSAPATASQPPPLVDATTALLDSA